VGGTRGIGDRRPGSEALAPEPDEEVAAERRLAAEEMRRPGDVEHQPVAGKGDERRVAVGPVGDPGKERRIRLRVGLGRIEGRDHRPRLGQRLAAPEPDPFGPGIERRDAEGALLLRRHHQRRQRLSRLYEPPVPAKREAAKPVGRKPRQGQCQHPLLGKHPLWGKARLCRWPGRLRREARQGISAHDPTPHRSRPPGRSGSSRGRRARRPGRFRPRSRP